MSCRLVKLSRVPEWKLVKATLLSHPVEEPKQEEDEDDWNSKWKWVTDDENANSYQDPTSSESSQLWLQQCLLSVSPAADLIAIGHAQKAVFLTSKWDVNEKSDLKKKFIMSYGGNLVEDESEKITSILCLPLASQKRSSEARPDWTCVIVGFSTGYIRIFTETAKLLLAQLLHEDSVVGIRCQTFQPTSCAGLGEQHDELMIIYETAVAVVDGLSLISTLKACRNQLARSSSGARVSIQPPPLTYKKWDIRCQSLQDCDNIGIIAPSTFDYLMNESLIKGPSANPKSYAPTSNLIVATGTNPYFGFYWASETHNQTLIGEAAMLVVNKVKSYLPATASSLLGLQPKKPQDEILQPKIEPALPLNPRHGLYDRRRQGNRIVLSPTRTLAAVTDDFGRVTLVDILKGIAIRFWKGYRDAQCGWIEVQEDVSEEDKASSSKKPKNALFLVIYAPRRGILEVWCAQQGPRVASFNVGKSSKLLYPGYMMMGLNRNLLLACKPTFSQCFLMDSEGMIRSILVPFHCALSGKNSKGARDLHLLKEICNMLKGSDKNDDELKAELKKHILGIKTISICCQALNALMTAKSLPVPIFEEVVNSLKTNLLKQGLENLNFESKLLLQHCCRLQQLLELYKAVQQVRIKAGTISEDVSDPDMQLLSKTLNLSEGEIGRSLSLVTLHHHMMPQRKKVTFMEDPFGCQLLSEFLSCFEVFQSHLVKTEDDSCVVENLPISFLPSATKENLIEVGSFLFDIPIQDDAYLGIIQDALKVSRIDPEKLMLSLFHSWIAETKGFLHWQYWINMHRVLSFICSLVDSRSICVNGDPQSSWWSQIRSLLSQATNVSQAYSAAILASSVAVSIKAKTPTLNVKKDNLEEEKTEECPAITSIPEDKEEEDNETTKLDTSENGALQSSMETSGTEWENISAETEQWQKLIRQLEDVIVLSALINCQREKHKSSGSRMTVSLSSLLSGGSGVVTEIVAEWAVTVGLDPRFLNGVWDAEDDADDTDSELFHAVPIEFGQEAANLNGSSGNGMIERLLSHVCRRFPHSLEHDVILANCCWEHMVRWNKDPDSVQHLPKALSCLGLVTSSILKHGVACLMWKTFVQKRFESLAQLMEKVGKTPKERLCRKDLDMSDIYLEEFLEFCCQLLELILEANVASEVEAVPVFQPDEHWQVADIQGPPPLVVVAASQKSSNYTFVQKHYELATALLLVVTFQMKNARCLSLYDMPIKVSFFKDLNQNIPAVTVSPMVASNRFHFLAKVTSAIVNNISDAMGSSSSKAAEDCRVAAITEQMEASRWLNRTLQLAREWEVSMDDVRRHYICELYSAGHDAMAVESINAVTNRQRLGSQLLLVAGRRVLHMVQNSRNIAQNLATMPPTVSTWLQTLDTGSLKCPNPPTETTLILIRLIINLLPTDQSEHKMALSLYDAAEAIATMNESSC